MKQQIITFQKLKPENTWYFLVMFVCVTCHFGLIYCNYFETRTFINIPHKWNLKLLNLIKQFAYLWLKITGLRSKNCQFNHKEQVPL